MEFALIWHDFLQLLVKTDVELSDVVDAQDEFIKHLAVIELFSDI